ncbi:MAG TPA: hypothetical protein ENJ08_07305, partial [Gammaproteobacteria bacterium]|nr:hypothetical protein [Gammaproteobacteria bacterium]
MSAFLTGCNNIYFKPDESPTLKKINTSYTEVYSSTFTPRRLHINFTQNGDTTAIYNSSEIRFYDLNKNKPVKNILSPDRDIDYGKSSKDGSRYLLIMDGFARILNTQNWQTIAQFEIEKGTKNNPNFSDKGTRLYIGNSLWNIETKKLIIKGIRNRAPISSDFSDNDHYFILADRVYSPTLVDMTSKKRLETILEIEASKQVMFRDNHSFYIDYGASGSSFTETLGLFSIEPQATIAEITPYQRISCWTQL